MYKLHGSTWVNKDGKAVRAQEVSDYLSRTENDRNWSGKSFMLGLIVGVFALAILSFALKVIAWAIGVVIGSLEILVGLIVLAFLIWGAYWLFRRVRQNRNTFDWGDLKERVASSWIHRGGET